MLLLVLMIAANLLTIPPITPPIVNGDLETGEDGVVLIYIQSYGAMCSGTLIAPNMVLTAKHCVMTEQGQEFSANSFIVGVGPNMYNIYQEYSVSRVYHTDGSTIEDKDLGILVLSTPINNVQPYPVIMDLNDVTLTPGETPLILIGYGLDQCGQNGTSGTKHRTTDTFAGWYSSNDLATQGNGANSGDSGGPIFTQDMKLLAVMSRASAAGGDCNPGYTIATAVASQAQFIQEVAQQEGICIKVSDSENCNNDLDDNCDGKVNEGCTQNNEPCSEDWECASGICYDFDGSKICAKECSPSSNTCEMGYHCKVVACGKTLCAPGSLGDLEVGQNCSGDWTCTTGFCAQLTSGSECRYSCEFDKNQCVWGEYCAQVQNGCGACLDSPTESRGIGEKCSNDSECNSQKCRKDQQISYCTKTCSDDAECPSGMHCDGNLCAIGKRSTIGEPCLIDQDCDQGLICKDNSTGAAHCTKPCSTDSECGEGLVCRDFNGEKMCWAPDGEGLLGDICNGQQILQCSRGACVPTSDGSSRCIESCNEWGPMCPSGTVCRELAGSPKCVSLSVSAKNHSKKTSSSDSLCSVGGKKYPFPLVIISIILAWLITRRRHG